QPDARHAQTGQIRKPLAQALEVADAVAGGVLELFNVEAIDDGVAVPEIADAHAWRWSKGRAESIRGRHSNGFKRISMSFMPPVLEESPIAADNLTPQKDSRPWAGRATSGSHISARYAPAEACSCS